METKSIAFPAAVPVPELLEKHNYPEWKIRMRTYLRGQDLWEDIINDNENENENARAADQHDDADHENDAAAAPAAAAAGTADAVAAAPSAAANVRRRNYMALHVIQISCGQDAFSEIRTKTTADTAWKTLKDWYLDKGNIDKSYLQYADLYMAVLRGNWTAAQEFLHSQPEAVRKAITYKGETALHIAVTFGHARIVEQLVDSALMSEEDLGIEDGDGYTSLMKALVYGRSELARYLYTRTVPLRDLVLAEQGRKGAMLLTRAIYSRNLDLALDLICHFPSLTLAVDDRGESPLLALASMRHAFRSGKRLGCLKKWIYSRYSMRIDQSTPSTSFETRLNIPNVENGRQRNQVVTIESVPAVLFRHLVLITVRKYLLVPAVRLRDLVSSLLGIKQLYEMKKINIQSEKLLSRMCEEISTSLIQTGQPENIDGVYDAINRAVKNGISEFVFKIARMDRSFLENKYKNSRNLLMLAVLYRQSKTFSLIYGLDMKNTLTSYEDRNDNNMLHMTGMIEDSTILNQISGAALQMQRELQWFKGVERIINPKMKEGTNKDGLTPRELFTKNHENMMEKGEKWMKDTSSSCTVVGALIVTIMFAAAFTLPGGNDQTTGFPIFSKKKLFMLFIISDALSLFSSSTSVLMFLGILTSRYAEEDFLESLPRKMILGLSTLFFSIATMMIAFSAALLIILHEQLPIAIPLICLAGIPVTFFVWIQFPILIDMIKSTYFPRIFNGKMKLDFN